MLQKEKIMDIYTLHRQGLSISAIVRRTGINWRTVKKFIENGGERKAYDTGKRQSALTPYHPNIEHWLEEDSGYQATWIFDRLKPLGYQGGYDQVKRKVRELKGRMVHAAYMRFETEPGKQAQVDFADFQVVNAKGETETVYLFAMVLGFSRRMYLELVLRRDMTNFLDCHINAFDYFGGVPHEILYDRMKNVLIRQLVGKLEWNKDFYSFCLHYRFRPLVAPPYAPWYKGKVERPIKYVRENFWRGYEYTDLERSNDDLRKWNEAHESRIHGTTHERVDLRFLRERPYLGPFPATVFDTASRVYRTVRKDCIVTYLGNSYVLPHESVGRKVLLRIKNGILRAFLDDRLVVTCSVPETKGNLVDAGNFYERLKRDAVQNRIKYGNCVRAKGRAKKTLGIIGPANDTVVVSVRPLEDYIKAAEG